MRRRRRSSARAPDAVNDGSGQGEGDDALRGAFDAPHGLGARRRARRRGDDWDAEARGDDCERDEGADRNDAAAAELRGAVVRAVEKFFDADDDLRSPAEEAGDRVRARKRHVARDLGEARGVYDAVARDLDDAIVAGDLAFQRDAARDVVHDGVEEEQRAHALHEQVRPVIEPLRVGGLVQHDATQVLGVQFCSERLRNDDGRSEEADQARHGDVRAGGDGERETDGQTVKDLIAERREAAPRCGQADERKAQPQRAAERAPEPEPE